MAITEFGELENIKNEAVEADLTGETRILSILNESGFIYRDLRRKSRIKSGRLNLILTSLVQQGKVAIINVKNATGPDTRMVSLIRVSNNSPEAVQKRKALMSRMGL